MFSSVTRLRVFIEKILPDLKISYGFGLKQVPWCHLQGSEQQTHKTELNTYLYIPTLFLYAFKYFVEESDLVKMLNGDTVNKITPINIYIKIIPK